VETVYDFLNTMCRVPERPSSAAMRMPISGIYKIKGVGDVLAGRVEQGIVKPGEEVIFLPTHTASNPCTGKVFTVEMHHQRADFANPGDNVGLNVKGLDKNNMPRSGDVMVYKKDNLLKKSDNMDWWKGMYVGYGKETIKVETVYDFLNTMCRVPERPSSAAMRMPISGIYKIKGVGDVLAGRVEQGIVKPGEEVIFLPTHTASNPCTGKVFTVEMHHQRADFANPGDNVGLNVKGLDKNNMPRSGDVMVYKKDTTLGQTKEFNAQIQVLDIPNEIKVGYSPIGFVRCGRAACRISALKWKMGKETGGKKMEDPHSLKSNEMAECSFQPQQPLVCDTFKNCEGLSRVAFMDGNGVVMLGKVVSCERKDEGDKGGGKKK